jgi:hypothetical protein
MRDDDWYKPHPDRPAAPPRQPPPAEMLFEFHLKRTHTFYRVDLRDHGAHGVEAQFLDPIDLRVAQLPKNVTCGKNVARIDVSVHCIVDVRHLARQNQAFGILLSQIEARKTTKPSHCVCIKKMMRE